MSFRSLPFFLGLLGVSPLLAAPDSQPSLPAGNPYAPAFAAQARLTPADRDALNSGKSASPAAAPIIAEINRSLAEGRGATSVDWGLDYDHVDWSQPHYASGAYRIAKIALATANNTPLSARVDLTINALVFARHVGRDGPLISYMVQRGIESATDKFIRKNLDQLSPQDARRLISAIATLPAGGNLATALAVDKMAFVDRLASEIRQVIDKLGETAASPGNFATKLRLAGILTDGKITSVGLEQEADAFWLKPGENKRGITLLSVDLDRDEALLACKGQIARVRLSSKKFTTVDFSHLADVIGSMPNDSLLRMMKKEDAGPSGEASIRALEQGAKEIGDLYAETIDHPEHFADGPAYQERIKKLTPLAQNVAPMLPRLIENEKKTQERQAKLLADLSAIAATPAQP